MGVGVRPDEVGADRIDHRLRHLRAAGRVGVHDGAVGQRGEPGPVFGVQINSGKTWTVPSVLLRSKVIRWDFDAIVRQLEDWD